MIQFSETEIAKQKKLTLTWGVTFLIVFPLLITLGLLMRMRQGGMSELESADFYSYMTLHGLGMAGVLFSMAFAALWYLNGTRYVRLNINLGYFLYGLTLLGVVGLTIGTLIGKFGAGWYMLYPLPFIGTTWPEWATGLSIISLIVLGVAWLIGCLHVVYALAKEFGGFANIMGWQYLGKKEVKRELPAMVLISTISLVPGIFSIITGAVMLILNLLQHMESTLSFDPLLLKNLIFFFGHTLVNITMYCAVAWLYALLPEFTKREWPVNKIVVYSWNSTFFFVMFAYFHHLYMDFVQPVGLHYAGQFASYLSSIPATAITMFGVIAQFYHSKTKWTIIPLLFLIGTAGWAVGGFAAVVDSTIALNQVLHNTLWVPAHFHTYMLLGVVLYILAFLYYLFSGKDNNKSDKLAATGFWTFVAGGFGFVLMFYLGGLNSIPRRFSHYEGINIEHTHQTGSSLAGTAVWFIAIVLLGLLMMYFSLFRRLSNGSSSTQEVAK